MRARAINCEKFAMDVAVSVFLFQYNHINILLLRPHAKISNGAGGMLTGVPTVSRNLLGPAMTVRGAPDSKVSVAVLAVY